MCTYVRLCTRARLWLGVRCALLLYLDTHLKIWVCYTWKIDDYNDKWTEHSSRPHYDKDLSIHWVQLVSTLSCFLLFFNGRPGSDRAPRLGWSMQGSACQRVCASLRPSCPLPFVLKAGGNGEGLVGLMLRENILPGRTTLFIIPERMQEIDCDRSEWSHLFSDARESSI